MAYQFIKRDSDAIITQAWDTISDPPLVATGYTVITVTDEGYAPPTPRTHKYDAAATPQLYSDASGALVDAWDEWFIDLVFTGIIIQPEHPTGVALPLRLRQLFESLAEAVIELCTPIGFQALDLSTVKIISANDLQATTEGMLPDTNTDPSLARINGATDKALRLRWAAGSVIEVQFAPWVYPPDLDDTKTVTVKLLARMSGATDTPTIAVGYFENIGDTNAGGNTGALSSSLAMVSRAIAAGDVGAPPKVANITLIPGTHGTDALEVVAAWVEYTRRPDYSTYTWNGASSAATTLVSKTKTLYKGIA